MYGIRDREAGNVIETGFTTKEMAQKCILTYEESDIEDGIYEKDFYEVFENEEINMKETEQMIINALNSESTFCERCNNFDDGKHCNQCNTDLLNSYKDEIYNQALEDLCKKIFEECVPLGTKDDTMCWFTKNRLRNIKSKLIK